MPHTIPVDCSNCGVLITRRLSVMITRAACKYWINWLVFTKLSTDYGLYCYTLLMIDQYLEICSHSSFIGSTEYNKGCTCTSCTPNRIERRRQGSTVTLFFVDRILVYLSNNGKWKFREYVLVALECHALSHIRTIAFRSAKNFFALIFDDVLYSVSTTKLSTCKPQRT